MPKPSSSTLTKVAIALAVALVLYLVYRAMTKKPTPTMKATYAEYAPSQPQDVYYDSEADDDAMDTDNTADDTMYAQDIGDSSGGFTDYVDSY